MANITVRKDKQITREFLPENKTHRFRFEINSSSSDSVYIIAQLKSSGQWQCSCRGWIRWRKCKHLETLMPELQAINESAQIEGGK